MGWNAGGFGSMRLPSRAALTAWKTKRVSRSEHDDWSDLLERATSRPDEAVTKRLAAFEKVPGLRVVTEGLRVELTYDDDEDGFRHRAGDVAAMLRAAAPEGAAGAFWFLGTAGAEGDFAFELRLGRGASRLTEVKRGAARDRLYAGEGYAAFASRVGASLPGPTFAAFMKEFTEAHAGAVSKAPAKAPPARSKVAPAVGAIDDALEDARASAAAAKPDKRRDRRVRERLVAAHDDVRARRSVDQRWVDAALALLDRAKAKNSFLALAALELLEAMKPDPRVVAHLEGLLAKGAMEPINLVGALKKHKSAKWKAIARARLDVTDDERERASLLSCLGR
jgi:hypothetical protein